MTQFGRITRGLVQAILLVIVAGCSVDSARDYPVQPVPFTNVHIQDGFWQSRMETCRTVTIPFAFRKCEETGRIRNFEVAGGLQEGEFQGIYYNDSDVFKIIEGASYSLSIHPDPQLEAYLDDLIAKIAAAQEDDGYLYTIRTISPDHKRLNDGGRWGNLKDKHELYNVGHMYEAAVAHYQATGKRTFLDVAIKNADLVASVFGPGKNQGVPGHEEIEIGLAKLYRVTGNKKYLDLAKFFLDQRGNAGGHTLYGDYAQDHEPVVAQAEAVGHAVRAGYLYSGMADVAALEVDQNYVAAIDRIWENIVAKKMYLTGGVGARRRGEAFGNGYELPNATAYNETCAAIAQMMLNHRLFLLHGEARYMDVFERILYNGFLAGVSLEGDKFFYPNPLAADGKFKFNIGQAATRSPWFRTSCCPTNVSRFMPSVAGYVYAHRDDTLYVNLFMNNNATIDVTGGRLRVRQKTEYPWDGHVEITLDPEGLDEFTLLVRIPGWARNQPLPSDLYHYLQEKESRIRMSINGQPREIDLKNGYAVVSRKWQSGEVVELDVPMPVRRVVSHERVAEDQGKVAVERGPIVYCAEGIDNGGHALDLKLPDGTQLEAEQVPDFLGGVTVIRGAGITLIPYYAWSHRGAGEMAVWLTRIPEAAEIQQN